jgi:predicted ArsR family transcriptional regulator
VSVHSEENRNKVFYSLEDLPTVKRRIVELLQQRVRGLTRHEIAAELVLPLSSVCGRVSELETEGWLCSTDETRTTQYGKPATVVKLKHRTELVQGELF